ncbi:MAG: hypothetical protein MUD14_25615 [Hydrococcus sp. Prado102]|jgi:hypothetical protein|nr:hypothetical protein [Hydrococcus sp. Prado102]
MLFEPKDIINLIPIFAGSKTDLATYTETFMTWEKEEDDRLISQRIGELCKNITRKKILAIARQYGWEIVSAGKEPLDVDAGLDLAVETEYQNGTLKYEQKS